jgi:hypothetical protein
MQFFPSRVCRWPLALTLIALTALSTGCARPSQYSASLPSRLTSSGAVVETRLAPMTHTITAAEAGAVALSSAYEVVSRLRPEFLRRENDGMGRLIEPMVYVDGIAAGPVWILSDIPANRIAEIRYVTPDDAFLEHGPRHAGGIIAVRMKR